MSLECKYLFLRTHLFSWQQSYQLWKTHDQAIGAYFSFNQILIIYSVIYFTRLYASAQEVWD